MARWGLCQLQRRGAMIIRFTPPHAEPTDIREFLTDVELSKRLPGRPNASTIRRWALRGVLVTREDGSEARLCMPYRKVGQRIVTTQSWWEAWVALQTRLRELALTHDVATTKRSRKSTVRISEEECPSEPPAILSRFNLSPDQAEG